MIVSMGAAARRLAGLRLAAVMVCAGGVLLSAPSSGLAASGWSPVSETTPGAGAATSFATGLTDSQDLTAVWSDGNAVKASVRSASTALWQSTPTTVAAPLGADQADVFVAPDGAAVATWLVGTDIWANVRAAGTGAWAGAGVVESATGANSPQAAIVNGMPVVYWAAAGGVVQQSQQTTPGLWDTVSTAATSSGGEISDLRVAVDANGTGVAAWLTADGGSTDVEARLVDGGTLDPSTPAPAPLIAAVGVGSVAVATDNGTSAVAWNVGSNVQLAVSTGGDLQADTSAPTSGSRPVVAVDASGRVFLGAISGGHLAVATRETNGSWGAALGLGAASDHDPSATADSSGDVVFSWLNASALAMRAYDASLPTVSVTAPPSPAQPGVNHTWLATSSDVWSSAGTTVAWTFTNKGASSGGATTASATHTSNIPGTEVATATVTDGAGNVAAPVSGTIQIASVAPANSTRPTISGASAPHDGGPVLTFTPGTWTGVPTPTISDAWQRCPAAGPCATIKTGGSYTLGPDDVGSRIRVEETATNENSSQTVDSDQTLAVAPVANGLVTLSPGSDLQDGDELTVSDPTSAFDGATGLAFTYDFQRCVGSSCTDAQVGDDSTYTLTAGDVGYTFQASVKATASSSLPATANSNQTGVVGPKATAAPTLSLAPKDTRPITASSPASSWDGAAGLDLEYRFVRCNAGGGGCNTVLQSTGSSQYVLTSADLGATIRVTVYGSKNSSVQTPSSQSAASAIVTPLALTTSGTPSGQAIDGAQLTAPTTITWADPTKLTYSYTWLGCGSTCTAIPGAGSGSTYVLRASDVGTTIEVIVTASANGASASVTSGATAAIAPQNTGAPSVTPPTPIRDGKIFTAADGAWDGATGLAYTYVWKRCDSTGASCTAIGGATGPTYTAGPSDVGGTLRVDQAASAGGSSATLSGDSSQSAVIAPAALGVPTITGSAQDTQMLAASTASSVWDGVSVDQTFQYERCDANGNGCAVIPGATSSSYQLTVGDIGSTIKVTASGSKGASAATTTDPSTATAVIAPFLLTAATAPTGTLADGGLLTAANGIWADADKGVLSYRYQWYQCNPTCTSLGIAAQGATYSPGPADVGGTDRVAVTAYVGTGQASTMSAVTAVIAPLNTSVSVLTTPTPQQDGQSFSVSDGIWDNVANLSLAYQWSRCTAAGATCVAIGGATGKTYVAGPSDVGQTLTATVTASKNGSTKSAEANAAVSGIVAPKNVTAPAISGPAVDGGTLTTADSTQSAWNSPAATLIFSYQWMRCDGAGTNCAVIPGAIGETYAVTPDDVASASDTTHARHTITVQVTADANGALWSASSLATPQVQAKPTSAVTLPVLTGDPIANTDLNVVPAVWTGTDISDVSFQWIRCATDLVTCTNIGTASLAATRYNVQPADIGSYVTVIETVKNRLGALTSQRAVASHLVQSNALGATDVPVVSGTMTDGNLLSTTDGTWLPEDGVTFEYRWIRCAPVGGFGGGLPVDSTTCPLIRGATNPTYALTSADVGSYILSEVKATYQSSHADQASDLENVTAVTARVPAVVSRPAISGVAQQGELMTVSAGTWEGTNTPDFPISYAYQWLRCDRSDAGCAPIPGATTAAYVATADDIGGTVEVAVAATNAGGTSSATSLPSAVVAGLPASSTGGGGFAPTPAGVQAAGTGGAKGTSAQTGDHSAPRLTLALVGGGKLVGNSTLSVTAACPKSEKTCKAVFTLLATIGKTSSSKAVARPVSVAHATLSFAGGQKKTLKLKLSSAARTVLKRTRKLKATLSVSVTDAAGNVTPKQTLAVTLRWK